MWVIYNNRLKVYHPNNGALYTNRPEDAAQYRWRWQAEFMMRAHYAPLFNEVISLEQASINELLSSLK